METQETQETPTHEVETATETPASSPEKETATTDWEAEAKTWREHARKWENRAKASHAKLEKVEGVDVDALTERINALEAETVRAHREAVAASYGVPVDLIQGDAREAMEDFAKRITQWRGETPAGSGVDVAGKRGQALNDGDQVTREQLRDMTPAQIEAARKAGRLANLMG